MASTFNVNCVPATATVAPCPTGFAPISYELVSVTPAERTQAQNGVYPSIFGPVPQGDVLVAMGLGLAFVIGFIGGVRKKS